MQKGRGIGSDRDSSIQYAQWYETSSNSVPEHLLKREADVDNKHRFDGIRQASIEMTGPRLTQQSMVHHSAVQFSVEDMLSHSETRAKHGKRNDNSYSEN